MGYIGLEGFRLRRGLGIRCLDFRVFGPRGFRGYGFTSLRASKKDWAPLWEIVTLGTVVDLWVLKVS